VRKRGGCAKLKNELVRAKKVFKKVCLASNKKADLLPQFEIVNKGTYRSPYLAEVRPPNKITLSKNVIDFCYRGVTKAQGDARLAFILGHELAHLANGDVRKKRRFVKKGRNERKLRKQEEKADDEGFIYAAIAGYPVNELLKGQQDFWVYWAKQTAAKINNSSTHPTFKQRAKILRRRLQTISDELAFFQFGVRLSHFNRCDEGLYFFNLFEKTFPAREVLNNKGYCYLQQAIAALDSDAYWLNSVLDVTTRAEKLTAPRALRGKISKRAKKWLRKARRVFEQAQKADAYYVPTYINLASTWLYLGNLDKACVALKEVKKRKLKVPNKLAFQSLKAILRYEKGRKQRHLQNRAIAQLKKLTRQKNVPLTVLYNTALLLETNKRRGAAGKIWQRLAKQVVNLPPSIRRIVCKKQRCSQQPRSRAKTILRLPVKVGAYIAHDVAIWRTLQQWERKNKPLEFQGRGLEGQIHRSRTADVLELDGRVEMVVLKKPPITPSRLSRYCGQTLYKNRVMNGMLWYCDNWTALVVNGKVKEIWVVEERL
jgi:tetratricopeptide (TPR) repeat protein